MVLTEDNNAYLIKKKVQKLSDAHHIQLLHYREKDYIVAISDNLNFTMTANSKTQYQVKLH